MSTDPANEEKKCLVKQEKSPAKQRLKGKCIRTSEKGY